MKNMFKAIIKNWVIKYGFRWPCEEIQNGLFVLFWLKSLSFIILGFQSSPIFHQKHLSDSKTPEPSATILKLFNWKRKQS